MRCPQCGNLKDKVVDTRISKEGDSIRRRRNCLECGYRFSTYETIVRGEITVLKKDEKREDFDPVKLRRGIEQACWKRAVSAAEKNTILAAVVKKLENLPTREVTTHQIGEFVMGALRDVDEVAYIRFASVYRRFKDIDEFIDEVHNLNEEK